MPKRAVTVSALAGAALPAGAGAFAGETGSTRSTGPGVAKASVAYVAPRAGQVGSLTFTAPGCRTTAVSGA
ncbi:hypothetical protein ABZ154_27165 [Streptomyces sp. NPDC006261]|uniref:hypothetical protein n=1 Tax=Streptomyces sp. NPDC006261 TaxID=3156739 RepID=UPI0033A94CBB